MLTKKSRQKGSDYLVVGDWTLDPATSQIERQDEQVHLEPRLTDLLGHFARNPRRVISKEELIEVVWGGRTLDNAAVARAVAELRKALGDSSQEPRYIETIPKRGYRLVANTVEGRGTGTRIFALTLVTFGLTAILLVLGARLSGPEDPSVNIDPPPETYGSSNQDAQQAYRLAAEALDAGGQANNESAVVHLNRALDLDPEFALAHARLAEAYAIRATWYGADGDWADAALAQASRAVALAPVLTESHRALGFALSTKGRFGEALVSYRRALELRPDDDGVTFRIGEILAYRGDWPDALAVYGSLPADQLRTGWLQCEVGRLLMNLEYTNEANILFTNALAREPYQVCSTIHLALFELATGDFESARSRSERLSAATATCQPCEQLLGEVAFREGRFSEARVHFEQALVRAVEPKSTLIEIRLARLENNTEALRALATSLERQLRAGADIWFPAWLLAVVKAELGEEERALYWLAEARERGHVDWRSDTAEPAFESLRETLGFESAVDSMRQQVARMRREVEERDLLELFRLPATRLTND